MNRLNFRLWAVALLLATGGALCWIHDAQAVGACLWTGNFTVNPGLKVVPYTGTCIVLNVSGTLSGPACLHAGQSLNFNNACISAGSGCLASVHMGPASGPHGVAKVTGACVTAQCDGVLTNAAGVPVGHHSAEFFTDNLATAHKCGDDPAGFTAGGFKGAVTFETP